MQSILRKNIADLEGYTPGEQPKQADLIKLNTNENPYPPSPRVLAAVRKEITSSLRLYPDPVALELRKRAAPSTTSGRRTSWRAMARTSCCPS